MNKKINLFWIIRQILRITPLKYLVSDSVYLKIEYRAYLGKRLDFKNPIGFNEKLQWLKIYDRKPEYTMMSDKYKAREYIAEKIGEEYLIPLLGVWNNADDIDFDNLPNCFVLKCNHDSSSVCICKDKASFDKNAAKKKLTKCLKRNFYWKDREDNYKNIEPKIIAEKFMSDDNSDELTDYKYFCFDGQPKFIQVDTGRFTDHIRNFYDADWNFIDVQNGCKNDKSKIIDEPELHHEMLRLARVLSEGIPHIRVDFYVINNRVYFGELTFHHGGGFMTITPNEYDKIWGDYLILPR